MTLCYTCWIRNHVRDLTSAYRSVERDYNLMYIEYDRLYGSKKKCDSCNKIYTRKCIEEQH